MVYAIIYELRCDRKRHVMRQLPCIRVGDSACLVDVAENDPRSLYAWVLDALARATGIDPEQVVGEGEMLYVIPLDDLVGRGDLEVDGWADRRGLFRRLVEQPAG